MKTCSVMTQKLTNRYQNRNIYLCRSIHTFKGGGGYTEKRYANPFFSGHFTTGGRILSNRYYFFFTISVVQEGRY